MFQAHFCLRAFHWLFLMPGTLSHQITTWASPRFPSNCSEVFFLLMPTGPHKSRHLHLKLELFLALPVLYPFSLYLVRHLSHSDIPYHTLFMYVCFFVCAPYWNVRAGNFVTFVHGTPGTYQMLNKYWWSGLMNEWNAVQCASGQSPGQKPPSFWFEVDTVVRWVPEWRWE